VCAKKSKHDFTAQPGSLLADADDSAKGDSSDQELFKPPEMAIINIPVEMIRPSPQQVRISSEEDKRIDELAKSMEEVSVLQPLIVEVVEEGVYQVLCGHRRLLAAKKQGMEKVPCIIRHERTSESKRILMMLIENIQRKNLSPVELAEGYVRLQEKGVCQVVIAGRVGKSESHVSQALGLRRRLSELWEEIKELSTSKDLDFSCLEEASRLTDPKQQRRAIFGGMTVRQIRKLRQQENAPSPAEKPKKISYESQLKEGTLRASLRIQGRPMTREEVFKLAHALAELLCEENQI